MFNRGTPRGMAMLEVVIMGIMLTICATVVGHSMFVGMTATRESGENAAVALAARQKMDELAATRFEDLVTCYGATGQVAGSPTIGNTFSVFINRCGTWLDSSGTKHYGYELPGLNGVPAGEIVIITSETKTKSQYGRSLQPDGGQPGGINFALLPLDLDGDGVTNDAECWGTTPTTQTALRLPVGVIIRWQGERGPERYELWTVMTKY